MPKLHQILAAERGVSTEIDRILNLAVQGLGVTGEQSPLSGISREYEPTKSDGDKLPGVFQHVQIRVEAEILPMIAEAFTRLFDVRYTRDEANTHARADVVIDGRTVLRQVPTTQLLTLENALGQMRSVLSQLPVLDPSRHWTWDQNRGWYAADETRNAKENREPRGLTLYEAKIEGGVGLPAQVKEYTVPVVLGTWKEVRFSGAMPADEKEKMLRRLAKAAEAVKMAREEANRIEAPQQKAGPLVDYIIGGALPSATSTTSSSSS